MSTLEVLNAIGEAHAALIRLPELEATIKTLTDERDFIRLERDEAEKTVERLKARITELENRIDDDTDTISEKQNAIVDLSIRNTMLSDALTDMTAQADEANRVAAERLDTTYRLSNDKDRLTAELTASRTLTESLQNVLKGIGRSILSAVEVPEVTSEKPFPVDHSLGLPDPASPSVDGGEPLAPLVSPKEDDLAAVGALDNSFNKEPAAGCFPYRYW